MFQSAEAASCHSNGSTKEPAMFTNEWKFPGVARLAPSLLAAALAATIPLTALAASHREAPFIATLPQLDATDFYMFNSYEPGRSGFTMLIADYLPLQDPEGGPNYFKLDPNAVYDIKVVNDGGAVENLTFRFRVKQSLDDNQLTVGGQKVSIPLVQNGSADVATVNSGALNVHESYTVSVITGSAATGTEQPVSNLTLGGTTFYKPVDNIGMKTISNYVAYANKHVWDISIPGCSTPGRVFVGQRKDPFVVNLGETFDLVNIKYPATELNAAAEYATFDTLSHKNVTALMLEVATSCLTQGKSAIIGGFTTSSLPANRVLQTPGSGLDMAQTATGGFVQVSRLGAPLVNELVIGLKDKDRFNNSQPKDDAQFATYVTNPTLPALIEILFGAAGVKAPTNFPRTDPVAAFLTGVDGLNKPTNVVASEMLRLNTAIPAVAGPDQNRLGVLGGDNAGFPNGRRPGDDVVDIELRVAMGVLCTLNLGGCKPADAPAGSLHYTDGAYTSSAFIDNAMPYLRAALPGSPNANDALKAAIVK
jgi:Domain of unknown function (DUF4331)